MRKAIIFALLVSMAFALCGCDLHPQAPSDHGARVITAVTVIYKNGQLQTQRYYNTDQKMQQIMNYLRRIDPYGKPEEDPETASGSDFHIELSYSDGSRQHYRQKSDRFMQGADGIWRCIDSGKATRLSEILGRLPSDQ